MQVRSLIMASRSLGLSWPSIVVAVASWSVSAVMLIVWLVYLIAPGRNFLVLLLFGLAFTFCSILAGIYFVVIVRKVQRDRVHAVYVSRLECQLGINQD